MILVTRFNNEEIIINADLIEVVEQTPDTVITMTTGKKFVIRESKEEVVDKVMKYRQKILSLK